MTFMEFPELERAIIRWAERRNLVDHPDSSYEKQLMKCIEEIGELFGSILKGKNTEAVDAYGDVLVTLIVSWYQFAAEHEYPRTIEWPLSVAYDEIRDRIGKTIDGNFVKDEEEGC